MKGEVNTDIGNIQIDREVITDYAGYATMESSGVVGMASLNVKDGVIKLLKIENASRGVNVKIHENSVSIKVHIIVAYGVSIRAVAQNVIENVSKRVEINTGLKVDKICVMVDGVKVVDD